ncbi:MAG TPA: TIR-like protein FxsC [Micromonosporaceae bacterium]|nr:TIR-like protein FxsC [Micromonosporaceae bacterium]
MLYFFLSYAHGDDDQYVAQLYRDLSAELRVQVGEERQRPVGFRDAESIRVGSTWPPDLVDAVATARTFVPLYSPRYFRSIYCGKEWSLFAWRIAAYEQHSRRRAPAMIPLWWVAAAVPRHLDDIHRSDSSFGHAYTEYGARQLVRMRETKHHDAYLEFVTAVAIRIKETAAEHHIPPLTDRPDLTSVPNAFDRPPTVQTLSPSQPGPPPNESSPGVSARRERPILRYETDTP